MELGNETRRTVSLFWGTPEVSLTYQSATWH